MTEPAHRKPLGLEDKIVREGRVIQARVMNEARKPAQPEQHNLLQMAIARVKAKQQLANLRAEPILNRDTHRRWLPHHAEEENFVFNDLPRYVYLKGGEGSGKSAAGTVKTIWKLRRGMNGISGCISADTMIEGVPVAERNTTGTVKTLFGDAVATRGFLKGKADLYRVETESGASVCVTLDHRFLSTNGWHRLRDLHVGDVIASDDRPRGHAYSETVLNSQGDYLSNFHLYDEQPNPVAQYDRDKWQKLGSTEELIFENGARDHSHVCTAHSFCHSYLDEGGEFLHSLEVDSKRCCNLSCAFGKGLLKASPLYNPLSFVRHSELSPLDTDDEMEIAHWLLPHQQQLRWNNPLPEKSLLAFDLNYRAQESYGNQIVGCGPSFNSPFIETGWTRITHITFQEFGQFYDLTVPGIGHYAAHGLFHHNSPDFEHYKKSLWAEFRRWVNPDWLVEKDRYRLSPVWEPAKQFELHFNTIYGNIATLYCGGFDDPTGWEGPNVNFAHFDEPRRHKEPDMLKVLDGRVRIPGPQMEPPQIYLTGTPAKHWLWEYFGNIECKCLNCETEFSDTGALPKDVFKHGICPVCGM